MEAKAQAQAQALAAAAVKAGEMRFGSDLELRSIQRESWNDVEFDARETSPIDRNSRRKERKQPKEKPPASAEPPDEEAERDDGLDQTPTTDAPKAKAKIKMKGKA